jgi:hypothetical protein
MAVLKREEHLGVDISSALTVMTYIRPATAEPAVVIPRIDLGVPAGGPVVGGGIYVGHALVDNNQVTPKSSIVFDAGQTKGILQGREITLEAGDVLTVTVTGQSGDTSVNISAVLFDNTPVSAEDLITGSGSVEVDHDYGEVDNLRYVTSSGAGIGDAVVRCYLSNDYNQGNRGRDFIAAEVRTAADGRWEQAMMLDPETYTLVFYKQGYYGPDVRQVTVSE